MLCIYIYSITLYTIEVNSGIGIRLFRYNSLASTFKHLVQESSMRR